MPKIVYPSRFFHSLPQAPAGPGHAHLGRGRTHGLGQHGGQHGGQQGLQGPHGPQQGPHEPHGPQGPHEPHGPQGPHEPHGPQQGPHGPQQGPHGPQQGPQGPPQGPHGPQQPPPCFGGNLPGHILHKKLFAFSINLCHIFGKFQIYWLFIFVRFSFFFFRSLFLEWWILYAFP